MTEEEFLARITCPNCGHVGATDPDGRCVNCGYDEDEGKGPVTLPRDPSLDEWQDEIVPQQHGEIIAKRLD